MDGPTDRPNRTADKVNFLCCFSFPAPWTYDVMQSNPTHPLLASGQPNRADCISSAHKKHPLKEGFVCWSRDRESTPKPCDAMWLWLSLLIEMSHWSGRFGRTREQNELRHFSPCRCFRWGFPIRSPEPQINGSSHKASFNHCLWLDLRTSATHPTHEIIWPSCTFSRSLTLELTSLCKPYPLSTMITESSSCRMSSSLSHPPPLSLSLCFRHWLLQPWSDEWSELGASNL